MIRDLVAPCFRVVGMAVFAAAIVGSGVARAQDRSTEDRLDRIERDLNMLQRQVYRGAPTTPGAPIAGSGANAADIEIRMERLESQMRDLTGHVEQVANGLDQLKQRVEQINSDIDVRLGEMSGNPSAAAAPPRGTPAPASRPNVADAGRFPPTPPTGGLMPPGTVVPPPASGGGLSPIFNTLTPPGLAQPGAQPQAAEPAAAAGGLPRGSANQQFNYAYGLVKQADYPGAEDALRAFVEAHPNDPLAAKAQYWLGQTYFQRNKYMEAAGAFADGYKRAPKGEKAPDNLLYLGLSLAKADQKKNACVALAQLDQAFPHAANAVKARAEAEKKRLGCS